MITTRKTLLAIGAGLSLLTCAVAAAPAIAQGASGSLASAKAVVDAAKARGVVGEQGNGFLGFVTTSGDAELKASVAAINGGRAEAYRSVAARTEVSEVAAAQAAAQQIIARLPPGAYYRPTDGGWTRK
ncbi:MAG: DUF1318 domain-containing protein [Caulobacteraceae bacterium]